MNFQNVDFLISAAAPKDFPKNRLPEIESSTAKHCQHKQNDQKLLHFLSSLAYYPIVNHSTAGEKRQEAESELSFFQINPVQVFNQIFHLRRSGIQMIYHFLHS